MLAAKGHLGRSLNPPGRRSGYWDHSQISTVTFRYIKWQMEGEHLYSYKQGYGFLGLGAVVQKELSIVADCTGEEMEPCLQGILFQETSAGTSGQGLGGSCLSFLRLRKSTVFCSVPGAHQ